MNFPLFPAFAVSCQDQQPLFQGHTQILVNEDNSLCEGDIHEGCRLRLRKKAPKLLGAMTPALRQNISIRASDGGEGKRLFNQNISHFSFT